MNHNKIRRSGQRTRYHEALDSCLHILEAGSQYQGHDFGGGLLNGIHSDQHVW